MNSSRLRFLIPALFLSIACTHHPAPAPEIPGGKRNPIADLQAQLDHIFSDPAFDNAFWGVAVQSAENGQILYERNSDKLMMPASNMKIVTAIAALKFLGPDFVYETKLMTDGGIRDGALEGNLVVIGSGDPTIGWRFSGGDSFSVFTGWASQLKAMGIETISGDVIGVDGAFDDERIGFGWSWDELPYFYATEIDALQFDENAVTVTLIAGEPGEPVTAKMEPEISCIRVVSDIRVTPDAQLSVKWKYRPESGTVVATGTIPSGGSDYGSFSIGNPAACFVSVLKEVLGREGIPVQGKAYRAEDRAYKLPEQSRLLLIRQSPPLREILPVMLKESLNLYAETLLKTVGDGSTESGIRKTEELLSGLGIPPQARILKDGSGLSRYNYVTPSALLHLLRAMARDPEFEVFHNALPVAGVDGTLQTRMKGSAAENNVRAKTGAIANVRALSGYLRTADGERLAFVIMANNFSVPRQAAEYVQDLALEQLVHFSRKP